MAVLREPLGAPTDVAHIHAFVRITVAGRNALLKMLQIAVYLVRTVNGYGTLEKCPGWLK